MSKEQQGLEIKVGLFVLIGLVAIAIMAVQFGRLGQGLAKFYRLTVEFPNASGLFKDADIRLAGAKIGHVAETPQPIPGHVDCVSVLLNIQDSIRFPVNSTFTVGSSGLLGDKFVLVSPPKYFDPKKFDAKDPKQTIPDGAWLKGTDVVDIADLMEPGKAALDKMAARLDDLQSVLVDVKTKILSPENVENLRESFASIKATSASFESASKKADEAMDGAKDVVRTAKEVMAGAKQTMTTANKAAEDVRGAIVDARGVIKGAQGAIGSAQGVLKSAQSGSGTVPMLLGNREVADNLRALIANIRRHGLLFYRDNAAAEVPVRQPVVRTKNNSRP